MGHTLAYTYEKKSLKPEYFRTIDNSLDSVYRVDSGG